MCFPLRNSIVVPAELWLSEPTERTFDVLALPQVDYPSTIMYALLMEFVRWDQLTSDRHTVTC